MKNLLIATTNPGKLDEIKNFLKDVPVELVSLKDIAYITPPEETGSTFEENAILKARYYANFSGLPSIADDGGFEIDALGGEPGVKSHRWIHGDRDSTDEELIAYTLERMKDVSEEKRGAQLRRIMALVMPDNKVYTAEGIVRGIVPLTPSGKISPGLPFRSLLYLSQIGKFFDLSDMTQTEIDMFDHRGKTAKKLISHILPGLVYMSEL